MQCFLVKWVRQSRQNHKWMMAITTKGTLTFKKLNSSNKYTHLSFFPCCDTKWLTQGKDSIVSNLFEFAEALPKPWLLALGTHHMTWSYYQPTPSWGLHWFIISEIYLEVSDLAPTLKLWTTLVELDCWIFTTCQMLRKIRQLKYALHSVKLS